MGEITSQAMSKIYVAAPRDQRAFCLTVTSVDGRDEGLPSSWSAALDGLCAGAESEDAPRRLVCLSAGNIEMNERTEYPSANAIPPLKDPNQAWNAISVGAMTQKTTIYDPAVQHWKTIADADSLSPSSRTSTVWKNTWPFKPDIVMEGGNNAIDPAKGEADFLDDLSLLTTRMGVGAAQLTTTGDTSAATALASRYAALIWSRYPALWPETVRALLIHSARWADKMMEEYPDRKVARLRTYGYGVPDLGKALSSVGNAATMLVEEALRPYHQVGTEIKTRHMHLIATIRGSLGESMSTDPYDDILRRAQDELSQEQMQRLVEELAQRAGRKNGQSHSIMELKGLGKEIWKGIDADEYVAKERDSWDG